MFNKIKDKSLSLVGVSLFIGVLGATSSFVTLFIDTSLQISIKFAFFYFVVFIWIISILLAVINELTIEKNEGQANDKSFQLIQLLKNQQEDSFHNIINSINYVYNEIRRDTVAVTATCIPFKKQQDKVLLYLIKNPNYESWWLAPGGHVDLQEREYPHNVAVTKCLSEAGLSVELLKSTYCNGNFKDFDVFPAPHFCYLLEIPNTASCSKGKHHSKHYDLTFVTIVHEDSYDKINTCLERKTVTLKFGMNEAQVRGSMEEAIREGKIDGNHLFPVDLPARVEAALRLFQNSNCHESA